uniref:Galectin domain-containing protein n=1 Tax=Angiostrongylus cantonensis TaxID=6313 RepID=A0A158PA07_ANGCA
KVGTESGVLCSLHYILDAVESSPSRSFPSNIREGMIIEILVNCEFLQTARRRPPLNRSIPPIPESRSNESIMSYASRRSSSEKVGGFVDSSQQMECVVIENRNAIGSFQRRQNSIPLLSSTTNSSEERRQSKAETTPRSPLMTVAKTVKNKFSKLTRIGRHEQDISMKGSQSFSGIRQPKSSIPKRIDQNANRVIKSSSMEVTSTSQEISGSSGTKRMVDFSEESSLAEEPPKSQEPKQSLSVTLSEDVLVISQELPPSIQRIQEKAMAFEEHRVKHAQASSEARNMSPSRKQHTFALGEKIPDTSSELKATEPRKSNEKIEEKSIEISALDKMGPIPRFVMTIKTPESMRKHQTFFIGLADAPVSGTVQVPSPEKQKKKKTKIIKQRSMPEASVSPERYVLRMKTPETLRRHHTFTIRERSRSPDVPYIEEGEITEPIATVGMTATKNEAAKEVRKRPNEKESTNEKLTVSVKAPSALRKLKTYITEEKPKLKTVSSSKSADTFLSSKTSPEHSQIVKRTAKPQMFLQSKKMQRAMENNESEHYVKKSTLTTAVVPATNTKLQALFSGETKATDQSETTRTMEQIETVVDLDREKEILENTPLKTAEMYVLTMMTPIPQRKETKVERTINDEPLERSTSPESVNLFVMGRRSHSRNSARCAVVRPNRGKIEFDRKEQSQSDRAEPIERKTSELSGEMTSPEEEIPMDTHLTPTEEFHHYDALIARSIRHLSRGTSPYNRAPEVAFSDLHISGAIGEDSSQTTSRIQEKATGDSYRSSSMPAFALTRADAIKSSIFPCRVQK